MTDGEGVTGGESPDGEGSTWVGKGADRPQLQIAFISALAHASLCSAYLVC